jgi:hypothetical protein
MRKAGHQDIPNFLIKKEIKQKTSPKQVPGGGKKGCRRSAG